MFNNKKLQFCLIILVTLMFVGVGSVSSGWNNPKMNS